MKNYVIACSKEWFIINSKNKFNGNFHFITRKKQLNYNFLKKINPDYIFLPHWSYVVPKKIFNNFQCVCFHTSHLPYGRGGSPIQNLIKKKFLKTKVCSLKVTKTIDGGPIYCKRSLSLSGSLDQIFFRLSKKIVEMIFYIIKKKIKPKPQKGKPYYFKRLTEKNSRIDYNDNINEIYDKVRMLDNDEYPRAFVDIKNYKILFKSIKKKSNNLIATAIFKNKIKK